MNPYIGHDTQIYGMEEHRLVGGRGDGMRLLEINNGRGLEMTVSLDRAADISRLRYKGINMSYLSPCGYVAPGYFQPEGKNWLKSFTAGFLTTCGLEAVGMPCEDGGEKLPLHGTIASIPAQNAYWLEEDEYLSLHALITDETLFGRKLRLEREIKVSLDSNEILLNDTVHNAGSSEEPMEILYHMNMGYPLLDEDSILDIASGEVTARDAHAEEDIQNWMNMESPKPDYTERCYYHKMEKEGMARILQPKLGCGLRIQYDPAVLDCFVEWKMMGVRDYVLGLECGNCYPDGRDVMRRMGMLKFLQPGVKKSFQIKITLFDC